MIGVLFASASIACCGPPHHHCVETCRRRYRWWSSGDDRGVRLLLRKLSQRASCSSIGDALIVSAYAQVSFMTFVRDQVTLCKG
jgi:hypothetical protein